MVGEAHPKRRNPRERMRADSKCRTCGTCRRKKVRCDGQHPKCSYCSAKGLNCVYSEDGRRTSTRPKRADLQALQKEIQELRGRERPPSGQLSSTGSILNHGLRHVEGNGPVDDILSRTADVGRLGAVAHGPASESQRTHDGQPQVVDAQSQDYDTASPSEANVIASGPQVFGATSLLHDQSSTTPLANRGSSEHDNHNPTKACMRDQLISNAALGRHDELTMKYTPSMKAAMDFDGVPMDTAMHLLDLHWNRQHLSYLITYRPAVMDSLIKNGPYVNKLLLNAIYLQSSMYSDREHVLFGSDVERKGMAFYERFKVLLSSYIDEPTIPTIAALLTCGSCLVPFGLQSAAWTLCGMAYRMLVDIGCHLDIVPTSGTQSNPRKLAVEQEMRRRLYWGAFVTDKFQSIFLGRAPALHEYDGNTPHEFLDIFEEVEEWNPYIDPMVPLPGHVSLRYNGRPTYATSTFQSLLRLCKITTKIIDAFYSAQSASTPQHKLLQIRKEVNHQLDDWKGTLPEWLKFEPGIDPTPPPHQITPHTTFWTMVILTEQAFLSGRQFNIELDHTIQAESKQRCIEASLKIWKLVEAYRDTFTLRRAQYGISYATYCAVLVLLQMSNTSEHLDCIRFFWTALWEYQKGCSYSLKRPLNLLKSLMYRLESAGQILSDDQTEGNSQTRPESFPETMIFNIEQEMLMVNPDDSLHNFLFDGISDNGPLADDTIFGMFM
ncbi:hypothetical protein PFICI_04561 [Pestalotiopsis fici W106-1]|uniref:Zn(2)-C6 fungal-type domain-containing protein n=1 Tax=Pestalotiopsis fici (strain W106-1 / CGMCC3.15140) TaxID=1229662 RepID=W3X9E7_PESFW|nr:uncharacterized protein PFICI_04561 [Pestalotiopsis fici W106-1]ETS82685.1 hypothetical protein PFICI_04561 [Pestalotiopsis fici W106-1]